MEIFELNQLVQSLETNNTNLTGQLINATNWIALQKQQVANLQTQNADLQNQLTRMELIACPVFVSKEPVELIGDTWMTRNGTQINIPMDNPSDNSITLTQVVVETRDSNFSVINSQTFNPEYSEDAHSGSTCSIAYFWEYQYEYSFTMTTTIGTFTWNCIPD